MKCAARVHDAVAASARAGELDDGLDAFASRAAEERLGEAVTGALCQFVGELPGDVGDVALQHGWAGEVELVLEGGDDVRVIVAGVMHAVSGEEVEEDATVFGEQLCPGAAAVTHIHAQQIKQPHPLRVDVVSVGGGPDRQGGLGLRGCQLVGLLDMLNHESSGVRGCAIATTSLRRIRLVGVSLILNTLRVKERKVLDSHH